MLKLTYYTAEPFFSSLPQDKPNYFIWQGYNNLVPVTPDILTWKFPAGEVGVRINDVGLEHVTPVSATIFAHIKNSDDLIELLMLTNAVQEAHKDLPISLICPYLPYSRQDRVCKAGDSFSLKVLANLFNAQNYVSVYTLDAHSQVSYDLINKLKPIPFLDILDYTLKTDPARAVFGDDWTTNKNLILVRPDAGAQARLLEVLSYTDFTASQYITFLKVRDPATGDITGMELEFAAKSCLDTAFWSDKDLLIIDDLCDGGRTFIEIAKILKLYNPRSISLYVNHGIFSKGTEVFDGFIDNLFCPYPF